MGLATTLSARQERASYQTNISDHADCTAIVKPLFAFCREVAMFALTL